MPEPDAPKTCTCPPNKLCASLNPEDRAQLCALCAKKRIEKDEIIPTSWFEDRLRLLLLNEGLIATMRADLDRRQFLVLPSDLFGVEYLFNEKPIRYSPTGQIRVLRAGNCCTFPARGLRDLFRSNARVAEALYRNLAVMYNRTVVFRNMTDPADPYNNLLYTILFLREHGFDDLTHEEFATITNLHRVTVTKKIHEILRNDDCKDIGAYLKSLVE